MKNAKKLTLIAVVTILVIQLLMSVSYAATATVITETLRLRKAPTTDSNILRNLDAGDKVEVISKEGDWYKISFDGKEGYIAAEYVKLDGEVSSTNKNDNKDDKKDNNTTSNKNENNDKDSNEIKLKANTNIYILPVLISSPIDTIEKETSIDVIETVNNWTNIEVNGMTGWVLNKYIKNFDKIEVNENKDDETVDTSADAVETKTGYVNVSSANVRAEASTDSEVVKTLVLNNKVQIIEKVGDWYKIKNGDDVAYIFANLVSDKKVKVTSRSSVNRTNTSSSKKSNTSAKVNSTTTATDTTVTDSVVEDKKEVFNTSDASSSSDKVEVTTEANVNENSTEVSTEASVEKVVSSKGAEVAAYAKKFIGHGYVYGGSGPKVFDCSGFTMYVFKQYGISLPHNARTQSNYGKHVSKENLMPGDLVIFNDYANTSIGHCGIYIGDGKIVHAANSKRGVTTDTILSGYYDVRFVEGRRLV